MAFDLQGSWVSKTSPSIKALTSIPPPVGRKHKRLSGKAEPIIVACPLPSIKEMRPRRHAQSQPQFVLLAREGPPHFLRQWADIIR